MRTEQELSYSAFRTEIVKWILAGGGSVTPAMVGKVLADNRATYSTRQLFEAEIEILQTSNDWQEAMNRIKIAFPREF